MRKRVVSRTINMVHGTATVIVDDTVARWEFDAPEAICKDLDLLRKCIGSSNERILNGWIAKIEVEYTYMARAVMDEVDFILAATFEGVKGGDVNE